jgi:metabolite-proton symporter
MAGATRRGVIRLIAASTIGTTIEFYDFFLYANAAALVFNKTFFPSQDPLTGTLLALGTYAVGFVARPIGGMVFGHVGDQHGRRVALVGSLLLMGFATTAIGLLPTYAQVGAVAPVLRLLQGFALGGEWGGAVLLVAEHGSPDRRGYWTSWPQTGGPLGNLLSTGVLAVLAFTMDEQAFASWGWRVPFLLSAVLVLIGWWIRRRIEESPLFVAARDRAEREQVAPSTPLVEVLRRDWRGVLIAMLARIGENAAFYMFATFLVVYLTQVLHLPRSLALNAVTVGSVAQVVGMLAFGALSDQFGRRPIAIVGAIGAGVWAFPFFTLVNQGTALAITAAVVIGLVFHAIIAGAEAAFFAELFGTRVRYSGASVGYQLGSVLGGALAPIVAVALLRSYGSTLAVSAYIAAMALLTVVGMAVARETRHRDLAQLDR